MTPVLAPPLAVATGLAAAPAVIALADACSHNLPHHTKVQRGLRIVAVAAVLGALTWASLARLGPAHTAVIGPLLVLGTAAVLVDLRERRLPDRLAAALLASTAAALGASCAAAGDLAAAGRALGGAALATAVLLAGKLASPQAVGWGDVKFAPALGAHLGWAGWPVVFTGLLAWWALVLLTIGAAVVAHVVAPRRTPAVVPFGPAMLLGTLFALVV
jgi:leader peptidase (prepilin peptidase)/N-methyltransferase